MPVNSTFDSHDLGVRDEMLECALVGRIHEFGTIDALLALALLHKEVITAVAIERELAASSASDALLCAAM